MTAHPESAVGRLRALLDAESAAYAKWTETPLPYKPRAWKGVVAAEIEVRLNSTEHAPALLAALEKEWDEANAVVNRQHEPSRFADGRIYQARETIERLAPLFEKPENPT